jgi:hypothetical protein
MLLKIFLYFLKLLPSMNTSLPSNPVKEILQSDTVLYLPNKINLFDLDREKRNICIELCIQYSPIIIKKYFHTTPIISQKFIRDLFPPSNSPSIIGPRRTSLLTSSMEFYEFMENLPTSYKTILPEKLSILLLQFVQLVKWGCTYNRGDNSQVSLKKSWNFIEKYIKQSFQTSIEMEFLAKIITYCLFRIFGNSLNVSLLFENMIPLIANEILFAGSFQPITNMKISMFRMGESLLRLYFDIKPVNDIYYPIYENVMVYEKKNTFEFFSTI